MPLLYILIIPSNYKLKYTKFPQNNLNINNMIYFLILLFCFDLEVY